MSHELILRIKQQHSKFKLSLVTKARLRRGLNKVYFFMKTWGVLFLWTTIVLRLRCDTDDPPPTPLQTDILTEDFQMSFLKNDPRRIDGDYSLDQRREPLDKKVSERELSGPLVRD